MGSAWLYLDATQLDCSWMWDNLVRCAIRRRMRCCAGTHIRAMRVVHWRSEPRLFPMKCAKFCPVCVVKLMPCSGVNNSVAYWLRTHFGACVTQGATQSAGAHDAYSSGDKKVWESMTPTQGSIT